MAMIWSNFVAGSALIAMAAAGVTLSLRPRMSATMISLPSPFILRNGAFDIFGAPGGYAGLYGGSDAKWPVRGGRGAVLRPRRSLHLAQQVGKPGLALRQHEGHLLAPG